MKRSAVIKDALTIGGFVYAAISFLQSLGFLPFPLYPEGNATLASYYPIPAIVIFFLCSFYAGIRFETWHKMWVSKGGPAVASEERTVAIQYPTRHDGVLEGDVERSYGIAELRFHIHSTTDWFEVGLRDSRKLTILDNPGTNGKMSLELGDDLAGHYFRVTPPKAPKSFEVTVRTSFEVFLAAWVIVFLRKADGGKLTIQVLDEHGGRLGDPYSYSRCGKEKNHIEFSRDYDVEDLNSRD